MSILTITVTHNGKIIILSEKPSIVSRFLKDLENTLEKELKALCTRIVEASVSPSKGKNCEEVRKHLIVYLQGVNHNMKSIKEIIFLTSKIKDEYLIGKFEKLGSYEYLYKGNKYLIKYEIN